MITMCNLTNTSCYELEGHKGDINGVAFSPDGRFMASASKDSSVIIWQSDTLTGRFTRQGKPVTFKYPVWSVEFGRNSKYILCVTSSIEYPVTIKRLNGAKVWDQSFYNDTLDKRFLSRFPNNYYGRYFSASFTLNDEAIRISTFSDKLSLAADLKYDNLKGYRDYDVCRIIYSEESYHLVSRNKYLNGYGISRKGQSLDPAKDFNYNFSFVDVSPEYIANNKDGTDYSLLTSLDRLPVRKFKGIQPTFSPDGKYLLCMDGKYLKLYPVDKQEVIRLTTRDSIFGTLDNDLGKWRLFNKDF